MNQDLLKTFDNGICIVRPTENRHLVIGYSTRLGGESSGNFDSLNVGCNTTDNKNLILRNRSKLFATIAPNMLVADAEQTHSTNIEYADSQHLHFANTDGLFTNSKNILLTITTADCGSILIYNKSLSTIAAIHSGWRGAQNGIIENIATILRQYDDLKNFVAVIGPMILRENYEVGKEFSEHFPNKYLLPKGEKYLFDLNQFIEDKLQANGFGDIKNLRIDTFAQNDLFYSYRRNNTTGRFCGFIGICE